MTNARREETPGPMIVDTGDTPVPVGRVRPEQRPAHGETVRSVDSVEPAPIVEKPDQGASYRSVLRSRRARPERVLVAIALVFILVAVAKPWDLLGPRDAPRPSPGDTPDPATTATARRAHVLEPTLVSSVRPDWARVDWTILASSDQHDGWGFGWVAVPAGAGLDVVPAPRQGWTDSGASGGAIELSLGSDQILALAVTWPDSIDVSDVTFEYLGGLPAPPSLESSGRPEVVEIEPVPAAQVLSWPFGESTLSQPQPWAPRPIPPGQADSGAGAPLRSGDFLIAPYRQNPGDPTATIGAAWRTSPWPWPTGRYWVSVVSSAGTNVMRIDLRNTPPG
jgi:hypothetical protein